MPRKQKPKQRKATCNNCGFTDDAKLMYYVKKMKLYFCDDMCKEEWIEENEAGSKS